MRLGLILADQLSENLASLRVLDPKTDRLVMAEVSEEASYVAHHKQKIAFLFSAMRHFAKELQAQGWQLDYLQYGSDSTKDSLLKVVQDQCQQHDISEVVLTQCGEYRLQNAFDHQWSETLGIPVTSYNDDRFVCSNEEFKQWASNKKQLRMEFFYREMRRKTNLLMAGDQPEGGAWNYDADNRKAWKGDPPLPDPLNFQHDAIDDDVLTMVSQEFANHPGHLEQFSWGTTRQQAVAALEHFIRFRLNNYGDYQDAMVFGQPTMFHSLISPYLNAGLLDPREVCDAAVEAYYAGHAPLNAVEGFVRQIIGWREFVRGIYWLNMPEYAERNSLGNDRDLPDFYWSGDTKMRCMSDCFKSTFDHAYAHHIQRLMVTGNFALLAGITPQQVGEWYLAVYADAYEWVEMPNTHGMVMHADGGYLASKPYAASGNYINKMSNYCKECHYKVKHAVESNSCPFNALYWHFVNRHGERFAKNPRMSMVYRTFNRMTDEKKQALIARGDYLLEHINEL